MPGEEHAAGETARAVHQAIEEVAALEHQALRERTAGERLSDALVGFIGRVGFVLAQVVLLALWFLVNCGLVPGVRPFDPFPFGILTLIVSTEGVLFTLLVLISQNRMSRQADLREHMTLQVGLLARKETARALEILEALRGTLAPDSSGEGPAEQPAHRTDVPTLARKLKERLPDA